MNFLAIGARLAMAALIAYVLMLGFGSLMSEYGVAGPGYISILIITMGLAGIVEAADEFSRWRD